jgi:hypothetical protein
MRKFRDDKSPLPQTPQEAEPTPDLARRSFLKGAALATAGASLMAPGFSLGKAEAQGTEEDVDPLEYHIDSFRSCDPGDTKPLDGTEEVAITALDFTQGLMCSLRSLDKVDEGTRGSVLENVTKVEDSLRIKDAALSIEALHELRKTVVQNADKLDAATGTFRAGEVTTYSQIVLVQIDYLISLKTEVTDVLYVFSRKQVLQLIEVLEVFRVCITIQFVQVFWVCVRFWLFILVVRVRLFPGLRISIDVFLISVLVCFRVIRTVSVTICFTQVRRRLIAIGW